MNKTILITGANSGLGKEAARQLALKNETKKIYLACRNLDKALVAKKELEDSTKRKIFEILLMDTGSISSVKEAVSLLKEPIDALIMNAGGMGGTKPEELTKDGVTQMFASNVLGHVVLVEELMKNSLLKNVAMYASSEAVRGVKQMGMKPPKMEKYNVEEFTKVLNGSFFTKWDPMEAYTYVKMVATFWMSAMARKHSDIRFVSVSPGGTSGTRVMDDLSGFKKYMFKYGMMFIMPMLGMVHKVETGAKRYVDTISDDSYKSGNFYASEKKGITGPLVEQSPIFPDLKNTSFQDNANDAIHQVIAKSA